MFSIQKVKFGQENAIRLVNTLTQEYAEVLPSLGAVLNDLQWKFGDKLVSIIDGYSDQKEFEENANKVYKSSFLFPFPNRIRDGKYTFESKDYQLQLNQKQENNALHGLVHDKKFTLISSESGAVRSKIVLKYVSTWQEGFPFHFEVTMVYIFSESGLKIESEIENHGKENMPFALGWHHYFSLGREIDVYSLEFPSRKLLEVDEQMIPTGKTERYSEFNSLKEISTTNFDTCFELETKSKAEVKLQHGEIEIKMSFDALLFPYLQIYTPPHRKSIAIEPMTSAPDVFNNLLGLTILGEEKRKTFAIEIQK